MAIKKVLVGDFVNGIPVHDIFNNGDELVSPDGKIILCLSTGEKIPAVYLPDTALTQIFEAANITEMLSLPAQQGDFCAIPNTGTYALQGSDPTQLANWIKLPVSMDLSNVYTKIESDDRYVLSSALSTLLSSSYYTKTEANNLFATKTELNNVTLFNASNPDNWKSPIPEDLNDAINKIVKALATHLGIRI